MSNDKRKPRYPYGPGTRRGSPKPAFEAAESVWSAAHNRTNQAYLYINWQGSYGATSDEVAEAHNWERYSSRPRISELKSRGAIIESGKTRKGKSGRNQTVWIVNCPEPGACSKPGIWANTF